MQMSTHLQHHTTHIQPIVCKYANLPDTKSLSILQKYKQRLRSLTINNDLWTSMKKGQKTLNPAKKMFNSSKGLRSFRLEPLSHGPYYPHQSKEDIRVAVAGLIERLKHNAALVNTYFHFERTEGAEEALGVLTKYVGHVLKHLRNFSWRMTRDYSQRRKRALRINRGLQRLPFLQGITIKFPWGFERSINPFNYWKKSFFGEKKLRSFSLEMMGLGCDRGHDVLIQNLAKSLQSLIFLQNLSIKLDCFRQVTIKGLMDLFEVTSRMPLLERISLEFEDCKNFSGNCLWRLVENLTKLPVLKELKLNFDKSPKIKNEEIVFLSKSLYQFEQLTFLRFDFSRCPDIDAKGMRKLGDAFKMMKFLRKAELIFKSCAGIHREDIERLVKDLKDSPMILVVVYQSNRNEKKVSVTNRDWAQQEEKEDFCLNFPTE